MAANLAGMAFVPYYNHVMKLLDTDEDLKKTAKGVFHQMAYSAGGAVVGGMIAGPPGGLVGGIAGAVMGYMTVDPYENMIKVLRSLDSEQQKDLVTKLQELVGSTGIEALTTFVAQQVNREIFMNVVKEFVKNATKGG